MENHRSCAFTLFLQLFLCFLFYLSLNLGKPRDSNSLDVYFLTVNGPPSTFTPHLLKQMETVARVYRVKFVIHISELGEEDDSLAANASRLFSSMNVPWYSSKDQEEQINIYNTKMLTLVCVNTESLQPERSTSGFGKLSQTLKAAAGSWLIVVGHRPVVVCEENGEPIRLKHVYEPIHSIFMAYGVNAYVSSSGCGNYTSEDGVAYIGSRFPVKSESHLASLHKNSTFRKKREIAFLLHRVSSAEFTTYFVNISGKVIKKTVIEPTGKEVM